MLDLLLVPTRCVNMAWQTWLSIHDRFQPRLFFTLSLACFRGSCKTSQCIQVGQLSKIQLCVVQYPKLLQDCRRSGFPFKLRLKAFLSTQLLSGFPYHHANKLWIALCNLETETGVTCLFFSGLETHKLTASRLQDVGTRDLSFGHAATRSVQPAQADRFGRTLGP